MSGYVIRPCRLSDLRELARTMRPADRAEITGAGLEVRHALFRLWRRSADPKTALLDGEVAACWGDEAGLLADTGLMWFFSSPAVERLPLAYFRAARREIGERLMRRERLVSEVAEDYMAAIRFFRLLGFVVGDAVTAASGARYRPMTIRRMG